LGDEGKPTMIRPNHPAKLKFRGPVRHDPAEDLKRKADRICSLIVASDYPDVDIDIEIRNLRGWCAKHLPECGDLFELVYMNRFRRLREQFRS